jgi:ketosteroid isomerase-like protein
MSVRLAIGQEEKMSTPGDVDSASTAAIRDLAQAWLSARSERDLARLASLTAADAVWHSPVEGARRGRSAVLEEVRRGFENADYFETELLALQCDAAAVEARVRNIATRRGKTLDSLQTLHLTVSRDAVREIRVQVDDQEAVEEFWK